MAYVFIIAAAIALAVSAAAHYLLFHALTTFFSVAKPAYLNILKISLAILSASFIIASILINFFSSLLVRIFYALSAVWLGLLFYFIWASFLIYLILFLSRLAGLAANPKTLAIILLSTAAVVAGYGLFKAGKIKIKSLDITLPNLPLQWRGKSAVYLSDLHLGQIYNQAFAGRLSKLIADLRPDLLLIGGDFYDGQTNLDLAAHAKEFAAIQAPWGKYFVTGNHEEFGDNSKFISALTGAGMTFLNNQTVNLNGLQLIGVDYRAAYGRKNFSQILKNLNIDKNRPSLLLRHVPDKIDVAAQYGISLMLSGHAHAGQLFPIQLIDLLLYGKFYRGLNRSGQTQVYTSSGAGAWGPPMRILADPEIVKINFK